MLYSDDELTALLDGVKTIAVVGANDRPGRPVNGVGTYLIRAGFTVFPVHPKRQDVWGLTTYPGLVDIPEPVDLIDVFRNPSHCPEHAREALRMSPRPKVFWMQSGITSQEVLDILDGSGIAVVQDHCLMVEHKRLQREGS